MGPTLLLTHPRPSVIDYYVQLVRRGILSVPGLHIRGIYHADEAEDYEESIAYIAQEQIDWVTLTEISCDLPSHAVYEQNDCSKPFEALIRGSSGLVVSGGPDLPPELYGRPQGPTTHPRAPGRHRFEISLLYHLLGNGDAARATPGPMMEERSAYAIMGICGGMQCINVAAGGTLVQDIGLDVYGDCSLSDDPQAHFGADGLAHGVYHAVRLLEPAPRAIREEVALWGHEASALSIHHQAIDRLGHEILPMATSPDGRVVEAIAHARYPHVLGWQFHPELPAVWSEPHNAERLRARRFAAAIWKDFAAQLQASFHET